MTDLENRKDSSNVVSGLEHFYKADIALLNKRGRKHSNKLLKRIKDGDRPAEEEFTRLIQPWIQRTRQRIEEQLLEDVYRDGIITNPHTLESIIIDSFITGLRFARPKEKDKEAEKTKPATWNEFSSLFQIIMRRELKHYRETLQSYSPHTPRIKVQDNRTYTTNPTEALEHEEIRAALAEAMRGLTPTQREMLRRNIGKEENLIDIGRDSGVSYQAVAQTIDKGLLRMRNPKRHNAVLKEWDESQDRPLTRIIKQQELEKERDAKEAADLAFYIELFKLKAALTREKTKVRNMFVNIVGDVPYGALSKKFGVDEEHVIALTSRQETDGVRLGKALDDKIIKKIVYALPTLHSEGPPIQRWNKVFGAADVAVFQECVDKMRKLHRLWHSLGEPFLSKENIEKSRPKSPLEIAIARRDAASATASSPGR